MASYYEIKRELNKIHYSSNKALKGKDKKTINFLLSLLDNLFNNIDNNLDSFGKYLANKEIKQMRLFLLSKAKELK